jgi:hypothetical protein
MDHRESSSLRALAEWDRAVETARRCVLASAELLARLRGTAPPADERKPGTSDDPADLGE